MTFVSYRGVGTASLSEASILRFTTDWNATLFFDIADVMSKAASQRSEDILLHRFERDSVTPRVTKVAKGAFQDTTFYKNFGPTIFASNEEIDEKLSSRGVVFNMPLNTCNMDAEVSPEVGRGFRERLTAFRAKHLGGSLPEFESPFFNRFKDITNPLIQIVRNIHPISERALLSFLKLNQEQQMQGKTETREYWVIKALYDLALETRFGRVSVRDIQESVNSDRDGRPLITSSSIGKILRGLEIETRPSGENGSSEVWSSRSRIDFVASRYGVISFEMEDSS